MGYQVAAGYMPLGRGYRLLAPGGWPQITAHDRLLSRFSADTPAGAPLSVSTDLYPHVSHRQLLYQFPVIGQARGAGGRLGTADRPATDVQQALLNLLHAGWGVADRPMVMWLLVGEGRRGRKAGACPTGSMFRPCFSFRAGARALMSPSVGKLRLLGYDVTDDPKWRRTGLRYYWQALAPLPADAAISVQVMAPDGTVVTTALGALWLP